MDKKNTNDNFEKIKAQVELLKQRLINLDKVLNVQAEVLDLMTENTKSLLKDSLIPEKVYSSTDEIMKNAFSKRKTPKILFK